MRKTIKKYIDVNKLDRNIMAKFDPFSRHHLVG